MSARPVGPAGRTVTRMEPRRRIARPRVSGPAGAPSQPVGAPLLGNRGLTTLLRIQRAEGWTGQAPSSKNRGGPTAITATGGRTVRRHALRGLSSSQMLTDMLIAVIPDGLPRDGSAVDVLVHLHGFEVWGEDKDKKPRLDFGTGYEDARARGGAAPIDLGVMQLEQQMSAAGRPLIGLLPQGSATSDFSSGKGAGFDLNTFVKDAFTLLTADQAWDADDSSGTAPTPGRATLSGHSGADQPLTQMLSGGQANDLAALFLFDTMYVTDAEKKAKQKLKGPATPDNWKLQLEGKVEAYVKARFDTDLATITKLAAADRRAWIEQKGFRLSVVHALGSGRYTESSDRLRDVVTGWINGLDPTVVGADAIAAIGKNYVFKTAAKGKGHMEVMGDGNFAGAIAMLPLSTVSGAKQTAPTSGAGVQRSVQLLPAAGNRARASVLGRPSPGGPVTVQRDDTPIDEAAEYASFNVRGAIEGGLEGYKDIRQIFIDTFGSIARANTYYAGVRAMPFLGRNPTVHASTLGAKLASAEQVLTDKGWRDEVAAALRTAGGFNIRRNRNAPSRLSDHSFGWAVDLDDSLNPNLSGRFPGRALMAATGTDVVTGAMDTVASGGSTADLLAPIEDIRAASETFKGAFTDEASLDRAMREHVVKRMDFRIADDVVLVDMVKAAAGAGKAGRKAKAELVKLLQDNWGSIPDAERWLEAGDREQIVANEGWKAWQAEKARRERAEAQQWVTFRKRRADAVAKAERVRKAGKSEDEIDKLVREPLQQAEIAAFQGEVGQLAERAAGTLLEMWTIFRGSFAGGRPGAARVAAQTEGTPSTIAAHGFMNLPAKLAAALAGSDGGNLTWLGVAGVHDLMHFELRSGDRPSLR
jgi:hypothetical protein